MASKVKEDEKHEKIIRGLLKLPHNRRCINCNSLGPQYVCTNFWTFVCTTCGGIHREFTHRVKSVSMAKFTPQEVAALQEGGNQRAREIYFKEWDSQRQTAPDGSNVDRLRDFIKHVYVDRRFSGEKNYGKPPSMKMGDKEDNYDNRRTDTYQGGSRSPPYSDSYDRRYYEGSSPGGRSPRYEQESRPYNDNRRSPEVVNDWRREDRFGNGRKFEDRSDRESKVEGTSPDRPKDSGSSSPPIVRPVREILGENVVPLRISEPPKPNAGRPNVVSAQTQRTASSSSLGSHNGNPAEVKQETARSLIDFDADPEPPVASVPQTQQTMVHQSAPQPTSTDNNWASFDFAPEVKAPSPAVANPLESVLSLAATAAPSSQVPGLVSGSGAQVAAVGNAGILPNTRALPVASGGNPSGLPFNTSAPISAHVMSTLHPGGVSGQWPSIPHQQVSVFPTSISQSNAQQFRPPQDGATANQSQNFFVAPNVQPGSVIASAPTHTFSNPTSGINSNVVSQPSVVESKPTGRKELPADLFTATYSPYAAPFQGWQMSLPRGMMFPMQMQYNNVPVPMPSFPQPLQSTNPFDVSGSASAQPQTFPSLSPLQNALPSMVRPSGLQHISSGTPSPAWMPSQSLPYPSALPSQGPSYVSAVPQRPYITQVPSNMPLHGPQGTGNFGADGSTFGTLNMDQKLAGGFSGPSLQPAQQPFSSVGGNPFG